MDHAPAQVALGLLYKDGSSGEADLAKASDWFDRAVLGNTRGAGLLFES